LENVPGFIFIYFPNAPNAMRRDHEQRQLANSAQTGFILLRAKWNFQNGYRQKRCHSLILHAGVSSLCTSRSLNVFYFRLPS